MMEHLGEHEFATELENGVADQLVADAAPRTPDLAGTAGSDDVTDDLAAQLVD